MNPRLKWALVLIVSLNFQVYGQDPFWQPTKGPGGGPVFSLASNPSGKIFAGTEINGVFSSTDNGNTWRKSNLRVTSKVWSLLVYDESTIFAGSEYDGLFVSTSSGESWHKASDNLPPSGVNAIVRNSKGHIFISSDHAIFRSIDTCLTWVKLSSGLPQFGVNSLVVNSNDQLFAASMGSGAFRSFDNGDSWQEINNGLVYKNGRVISLDSTGTLYLGSFWGIYRSTDLGNTWTLSLRFPTGDPWTFAVTSSNHILAGIFGSGIFLSTNNGLTWQRSSYGLEDSAVTSLTLTSSGDIFAGTRYDGIFRSTDDGSSWTSSSTELTNNYIQPLTVTPQGHILAGTYYGTLFRSENEGETWNKIFQSETRTSIYSVASNNQHIFVAGKHGVFRSEASGSRWERVLKTAPDSVYTSMLADSTGLVLASSEGSIYRSIDNGEHWTKAYHYPGIGIQQIISAPDGSLFTVTTGARWLPAVLLRSTDKGNHWTTIGAVSAYSVTANTHGHIFVATGKVFRSTDGGSSWQQLDQGLSSNRLWHLCLNGTELYAAGSDGVFQSTDNGENWTLKNSGITHVSIQSIVAHPQGYVLLGTWGDAVLRSAGVLTSASQFEGNIIKQFQLDQNYPNPFNATTTIKFSLPKSDFVTLKLYDFLGRETTTLVSNTLSSGTHYIRCDVPGLATGIYIYRLVVGDLYTTRKLILVR